MGKFLTELNEELVHFIHKQHMFFTATAPSNQGRINLSPKGYDCLKIINTKSIIYLDYAGSGNETANHIKDNQKITLMWNSFDQKPLILRIYGYGEVIEKHTENYLTLMEEYYPEIDPNSARQIFRIRIEAVQTSCGYGVPLMDYNEDRDVMMKWTNTKVSQGKLDEYIDKHGARLDEKHPINNNDI
ncbi:pyridoxamine 5'-phosphate oxidase family protein [Chengkuizengella axinellae]|uniref:Pyridoxamine 5'-phosphate oxidase family protein n=1 Tax=Chengkuizengella axinellae TaxID=3064388 RepID=A0ABT9IWN4_9BACL|nr:pyridoxamine 5'-phosphate oxidase family protein [Chengkuizengella sp. 2205SS18-9]MDP5273732.1 pyridoxamine 5'-phosphate oxidase family protein [Chengkuizengella sp. 2205SS18-9]